MTKERVTRDELIAELDRAERAARAAEKVADDAHLRRVGASLWERQDAQAAFEVAQGRFELLKEHWTHLAEDLQAFDRGAP